MTSWAGARNRSRGRWSGPRNASRSAHPCCSRFKTGCRYRRSSESLSATRSGSSSAGPLSGSSRRYPTGVAWLGASGAGYTSLA
uniref:Uncharacterized protein n=1 Tax=uncultured marine virus TaxID=186617 RepID=A0A0F7L9D7_9VIRU|nr:hypothetical protein [uncultured marine virus]